MRLDVVHFGAFKSLYDTACDFGDMTAVTGPNGAGKSNLAEGLAFVSDAYRDSLEIAVARAGGYDSIAHRRSSRARTPVSVDLQLSFTGADLFLRPGGGRIARSLRDRRRRFRFRHRFSVRAERQSLTAHFAVEDDDMELWEGEELVFRTSRRDGRYDVNVTDFALAAFEAPGPVNFLYPLTSPPVQFLIEQSAPQTELMLNLLPSVGAILRVIRNIARMRVFQLSPQVCRQSGVPTPNASLSRYGENLPSVADYLRRHSPDAWQRIESAMGALIPNLSAIEVVHTEDRRLALQFRERGARRPWNANEMSDGTIQALALFVAIFDERSPILVVEEPENSLHPWILRLFVDLCRSTEKQVILTTHSPVLLNYMPFYSLRFMWQRNGRSGYASLEKLDPNLLEMWKSGEVSAFDGYDQGLISEVVPEHFGQA